MRVGIIYYKYPLYPQGSYFQEFLNELAKSVSEIYLIATNYPQGNFAKPQNMKIIWVPLLNAPILGELFFMLCTLFRAVFDRTIRKLQVVNSIGPRGILAGWYLKRRYQIPLICTIEMLNESGGSLANYAYYFFVRFLLTKAPVDKFICWSEYYWTNHLKKWGIPEEKVAIIPPGINLDTFNPSIDGGEIKERYSPQYPLIVFAKPLYSVNIQAAKILVCSLNLVLPETKVTLLLGSGEGKDEVQRLVQSYKLGNWVKFMPQTSFLEIPKFLAAADLIVLPFTYAPTVSRSLLEAMAMRKPVITSPVGEVKNILCHGENAILVEPQPKEIAEAIKSVLGDQKLCQKISDGAINLVKNNYPLPKVVRHTTELYLSLIK